MSDLRKCCGTPRGHASPHAHECQQGKPKAPLATAAETAPDWSRQCEVCGQSPVVPITGMCGPCTFGAADTMLGNW